MSQAMGKYELDASLEAEIVALACERHALPEDLVREAVASYLANAEYERKRAAIMANLKHPEQDNRAFGSWQGSGLEGLAYQNELRGNV